MYIDRSSKDIHLLLSFTDCKATLLWLREHFSFSFQCDVKN